MHPPIHHVLLWRDLEMYGGIVEGLEAEVWRRIWRARLRCISEAEVYQRG
jgi:hypothetical protein